MKKSKYIIVQEWGAELPIVFSELLKHSEVAGNKLAVSGGFVSTDADGKITCYGESTSLRLESRGEEDAAIIRQHLYENI